MTRLQQEDRVIADSILRFVRGRDAVGRRLHLRVEGFDVDTTLAATTSLASLDDSYDLECDRFGAFKLVTRVYANFNENR